MPTDSHRITDLGESIQVHGVAYGPDRNDPLPVHHRSGDIVVCKIAGHKSWSGNFRPWDYTPAQFLVLRLFEQQGETRGEPIVCFEIRK